MENFKLHEELAWLLKNEVPLVIGYLEQAVTKCLRDTNSKSTTKYRLLCTSSTSGAEALRGSVMLHRDTLCSMELFIKPSRTISSIKASFRNDKQWKLQQVQDAYNHLLKANLILAAIKQCNTSGSPHAMVCELDSIIKHLTRCQTRLISPCQLSLQALIGNGFTKMFAPALPGDTLMNVFVTEDRLIVTHYTVQQAHTNASLNASKGGKLSNAPPAGKALFHNVGSILEYGGIRYEVSTANRSECTIPLLTSTIRTASNAQMLCQSLKDKLMTLRSHWPTMGLRYEAKKDSLVTRVPK